MDLTLTNFLKSSILEKKDEKKEKKEKYTYKDEDGNKITVKKDKDGKITKIDKNGNEIGATELELKDAKSQSEKQSSKDYKEAEKQAKKAVKREEKEEKKAERKENFEKHLEEFGKNFDDTMMRDFGAVGKLIALTAHLTVGSAYSLVKNPEKAEKQREENLAIANKTEEILKRNKEALNDEQKRKLEETTNTLNTIIDASYDKDGNLLSPKDVEKNLQNKLGKDKFRELVKKNQEIAKKNPVDKDLDKIVKNLGDDINKLKKETKTKSSEIKTKNKSKSEESEEYKKAEKSANKKLKDDLKLAKSTNDTNTKALDVYKKDLENSKKKLEKLQNNKPKDMSDEVYNAEIAKLNTEIEQKTKSLDKETSKIEKSYKKSVNKAKSEHKKSISQAKEETKSDSDTVNKIEKDVESEPKDSKEKEETVKDKDGTEIVARKKKRGKGKTYVRKKGGKEVGGATKDQFIAAKKRSKNESLTNSLKNMIIEDLEDFIKKQL